MYLRPEASDTLETSVIRRPKPLEFVRKGKWSHSLLGVVAGIVAFALAFVNLGIFFGLAGHRKSLDEGELYSKLINTVVNAVTVLIGQGDGNFQPPVAFPAGSQPTALVVADFNGDFHADLAVAVGGTLGVVAVGLPDWASTLASKMRGDALEPAA